MHSRGSRESKTIPDNNRANTSKASPSSAVLSNGSRTKSMGSHSTLTNGSRGARTSRTRTSSESGAMHTRSALRNDGASIRARGSSTAQEAGSRTTALGNNVAVTTATASLNIDTVDTLGQSMGSESTTARFLLWGDIPASNTAAIGSVLLTHGQNTGQITG